MNNKIKLILLVPTVCVSCNSGQDLSLFDYEYTIPTEFEDGIKTASLQSVGDQFMFIIPGLELIA